MGNVFIIPLMIRSCISGMLIFLAFGGACVSQPQTAAMPDSLVIGRHSFIDVGPPFDFYEVIRVKRDGDSLAVERALVTPLGPSCGPLATVEVGGGKLHGTMSDLLGSKNPCSIPETDLHRELKRCKTCVPLSGVDVSMQVSCGEKVRQLRVDILDRDLFDSAPRTPENTGWTMAVLSKLDKVLGPGVWDRPMFATGEAATRTSPDTEFVQDIRIGRYDDLFGKKQLVSLIALDAEKPPPPPPSVELESVTPVAPISPKMPDYPPIAKAARVEGVVNVTFDVSSDGKVQNLAVVSGPRLLQTGVLDELAGWSFPQPAWGAKGAAAIRFRRNCAAESK
jgi:TonB family protein